jgi:division protein CdvB (Snf7/Vps24/ESCRT-III family)
MSHFENKLLRSILSESDQMDKTERNNFLKTVANFNSIGESVYGSYDLNEVVSKLSTIVEQAEVLTMQESEHWFDNVTVSRHMKQLKEAFKVFEKTATEINTMQQRLESAYDDMGVVLNRYYKVNNTLSEFGYTAGVDDNIAGKSVPTDDSDKE